MEIESIIPWEKQTPAKIHIFIEKNPQNMIWFVIIFSQTS